MDPAGITTPHRNLSLAIALTAAALALAAPRPATAADPDAPAPDAGLLMDTLQGLDNLLAAEDTSGPVREGAAPLPPLESLISPDVREAATTEPTSVNTQQKVAPTDPVGTSGEAVETSAGVITVYETPATEAPVEAPSPAPTPAVAPVSEPEATSLETADEPFDGIIPDEDAPIMAAPLPPALNTLPGLPDVDMGTEPEAVAGDELFAGGGQHSISTNVTINLISKLVERGVLTQGDAAELIQVAQMEAAMASQMVQQGLAPTQDGAVRVTYVPGVVREQIRDEVKASVMAQAKAEGWAAPNQIPDWLAGLRPFGDIRLRYEYSRFPVGNDNTGAFPNFNSINSGSPFDTSGLVFSPQYNVDQDRQRFRLRARMGAELTLADGFSGGLRLATGEGNSPVSPNQTLGGSGGNFSKYQIWLDRGFIKYELGGIDPDRNLALTMGRFDNPFLSTDLIWDDDLGFDGIALSGRYEIVDGFTPFAVAGMFPVFNTEFNYASNQPSKFESEDKWLYAAQLGIEWDITDDIKLKLASAYYDFDNVEGRLSDPYIPLTSSDAGNTDATRPSFAQKGNTYRPLRNIIASPLNDFGTSSQYQYFGLATPFREIAFTGRLEINTWEPYQIALIGEYVKNLDFDQESINTIAVNNRGPSDFELGSLGQFEGGDQAWLAGIQFGRGKFEERGDWRATIGYRYVESDAVVDAFTDSDFGGGGTNVQGYVIGAAFALSPDVALGIRWMTADEVAGPPLKSDLLQVDITAKF